MISESLDADGARWRMEQRFTPAHPGAIDVESRFSVDRDQTVFSLPLVTLLSGLGSFGTNKTQGLFCGLEYLENEPSSSEADVIGPEAERRVPDRLKITVPLMAIAAQDRYVGLIWQLNSNTCAAFDSPDRVFGSNGHLMGLMFPRSIRYRERAGLLSDRGVLVRSNEWFTARATFIGGIGPTVIPALKQYVTLRGLPSQPAPGLSAQEYFKLAAHGWLDSELRTSNLFRHSSSEEQVPVRAADAAVWMQWLAEKVDDPSLKGSLSNAARAAIQQLVSLDNCNDCRVGHIPSPLPALIYNAASANAVTAQANARGFLAGFQSDGSVLYEPMPGGVDYGRTHYAPEANGHTASAVLTLLHWALFSGDRALLATAMHHLHAMNEFRNTVPRGAPSSAPLHAPDLLAAAQLVRCYTLGYDLTGDPDLLEQARDWAWSGLPFIYLVAPTSSPVGAYCTISTFGASDWSWPMFGVPIAWPGLIYADALYFLAKHDPVGPWLQIADGITAAGIQQCWPAQEPSWGGLLPLIFLLSSQTRQGPAINPATLQADALRFYRQSAPCDFHSFRGHRLLVHAPGEIGEPKETEEAIDFRVQTWSSMPSSLLVTGFAKEPQVRINGQEIPLGPPHHYQSTSGRLELQLQGASRIEILTPTAIAQ